MAKHSEYDCAIVGGGVAGLALAILLARAGKGTILFEKEKYPFHKVCGEYISNESIPFLKMLGLDLKAEPLPQISRLLLSSPSGISVQRPLDLGGTGLSRYVLDERLCRLAIAEGVTVLSGTRVKQVAFKNNVFHVSAGDETFTARTVAGAYGKNSNLDAQLGRSYRAQSDSHLFIAVKHHIRADFDPANVEIHNFKGGYCGMSAIEAGKVNMSYISRAANLKQHGSIAGMEKNVLSLNPFLKKYFSDAEFLFEKPLTISHLFFGRKSPVTDHILMLGDAAGNIAPLSGNGMSMALHSAKLAQQAILPYLNGSASLLQMEQQYAAAYAQAFAGRIRTARFINSGFGQPALTDIGFRFLKAFPKMVDLMSRKIHGNVF